MTPFTDDDLKRLCPTETHINPMTDREKLRAIPALLARLEMAEAFIAAAWLNKGNDRLDDIYKSWRKLAGK